MLPPTIYRLILTCIGSLENSKTAMSAITNCEGGFFAKLLHGSARSANVQSDDAHVLLLPGYARSERELAGSTTAKPRPQPNAARYPIEVKGRQVSNGQQGRP